MFFVFYACCNRRMLQTHVGRILLCGAKLRGVKWVVNRRQWGFFPLVQVQCTWGHQNHCQTQHFDAIPGLCCGIVVAVATSHFTHPPPQCRKLTSCHQRSTRDLVQKSGPTVAARHCTAFFTLSALSRGRRFSCTSTVGSFSGLQVAINKPSIALGSPREPCTGPSGQADHSPRRGGLARPLKSLKSFRLFFGSAGLRRRW
jgi:hypothetical protein